MTVLIDAGTDASRWYQRCIELIEHYADLGLGVVDASVATVAEHLKVTVRPLPRSTAGTSTWPAPATS
ncbi:MAG: hypothetical protein ACYDH5_03825 [Acidimicrobiales bacterium]